MGKGKRGSRTNCIVGRWRGAPVGLSPPAGWQTILLRAPLKFFPDRHRFQRNRSPLPCPVKASPFFLPPLGSSPAWRPAAAARTLTRVEAKTAKPGKPLPQRTAQKPKTMTVTTPIKATTTTTERRATNATNATKVVKAVKAVKVARADGSPGLPHGWSRRYRRCSPAGDHSALTHSLSIKRGGPAPSQ